MSRKLQRYVTRLSICTAWVGVFTFGIWLTSAQADSSLVAKGEEVYAAKKCAVCHVINGKGGKAADDLTSVGAKRNAGWLNKFMKDPKSVDSSNKMPAFRGSDEELAAVVAYMASLK
jgi:mono/diheme cytochrome c family protein